MAGGIDDDRPGRGATFNLTDLLQRSVPNCRQGLQNQVERSDYAMRALSNLTNDGNSELSQCGGHLPCTRRRGHRDGDGPLAQVAVDRALRVQPGNRRAASLLECDAATPAAGST